MELPPGPFKLYPVLFQKEFKVPGIKEWFAVPLPDVQYLERRHFIYFSQSFMLFQAKG